MSTTHHRSDVRIPPIQRLSPSTISQLRSSVNITSLTSCISELLQNALDAAATNIKVTVNLQRNSCIVEDNGHGIPPEDLKLVGERYASSKHHNGQLPTTFGSRGEALASIATNSTLSVCSRARTHRSTNLVRFNYGTTPIFNGLAPEHMRIWGDNSGTTVRVETLFGNFPVRLKAQENLREGNSEREWDELRRVVAGLLVVGGEAVTLTVRDVNDNGDGAVKIMVRPKVERSGRRAWGVDVLRQVFGVGEIGKFEEWEWVKARRGQVRIEGWISKVGCASKRYQFLSVNGHPLNSRTSYLHSELNEIIANSKFGKVEGDQNKENRQTKINPETRNPIDRWCKCIFRITIERAAITLGGEGGTDGKGGIEGQNLKEVANLLQRLVSEFLKSAHLRPKKTTSIDSAFRASKKSNNMSLNDKVEASSVIIKDSQPQRLQSTGSRMSSTAKSTRHNTPEQLESQRQSLIDLEAWTNKAKSARRDRAEEVGRYVSAQATVSQSALQSSSTSSTSRLATNPPLIKSAFDSRDTGRDAPVIPNSSWQTGQSPPETDVSTSQPSLPADPYVDTLTTWTDPISHKKYQINARTGNVTLPKQSLLSHPSGSLNVSLGSSFNGTSAKPLRLAAPARTDEPSPFIRGILEKWENPVFAPTEQSIPNLQVDQVTTGVANFCSHNPEKDRESFLTTTSLSLQKMSKEDLRGARVIQQVDRKFILATLPSSSFSNASSSPSSTSKNSSERLLVLIDQHAASERIRVEQLFVEVCQETTPVAAPSRPLLFQLSVHEAELLKKYEAYFASWGISYQQLALKDVPEGQTTISIRHLPSAIVRRCVKEPSLAIDLLRSYARHLSDTSPPSIPPSRQGKSWVESISSMPRVLMEMINSKACRGAVMFNDVLSVDECVELVRGLAGWRDENGEERAGTRMPFICAHGRPSVVPLVDLGMVPEGMVREEGVQVGKWRSFLGKRKVVEDGG